MLGTLVQGMHVKHGLQPPQPAGDDGIPGQVALGAIDLQHDCELVIGFL
jgi:hypothetical protein